MTTPTAPLSAKRKTKTRTTTVSARPALLLSELPLTAVDRVPRFDRLACPECGTWCPLTTHKGTKQLKLVPHHTTKAGTPGARRCGNSNRLFTIDIPLVVWQARRAEAVADVAARRPTTVLKKVKTPVVPALHQLTPAAPTADTARRTYEAHRSRCAACTGHAHCTDGLRLEDDLRVALYREPERLAAQARAEQEQRAAKPEQAKKRLERRAEEWSAARVDALIEKRRWAQFEHFTGDLVEPIRGAAVPKGARPIGTVRSADDVLDENPIRKNQQLSA
ncbi:hypothetical protein GCM10009759_77300 [Kitasatospora saccharophila]|uniref:Uncharacterized protein n=1 Tax=Kitasatospora saccharophila TaxID=407973 RepID=A0ABN2YC62_9ACTN